MRSDMHAEAETATAALPPSVAYLFHTVVAGNSDARVAGGLLVAWIVFFAVGLCQVLQSWDYFQGMFGISPSSQHHVDLPA